MEINLTLTQLFSGLFFLISSISSPDNNLPKISGEQIIFNTEKQLILQKYEQKPCPIDLNNYFTIYDENQNHCVYVPTTELIKFFLENK